jgi:hypothetical protein
LHGCPSIDLPSLGNHSGDQQFESGVLEAMTEAPSFSALLCWTNQQKPVN